VWREFHRKVVLSLIVYNHRNKLFYFLVQYIPGGVNPFFDVIRHKKVDSRLSHNYTNNKSGL
jgi:hypothetical protein